jgi:hypothetical protein
METAHVSTMVDGYFELLTNLSLDEKLELISRLSASAKSQKSDDKETFRKAYGSFDSEKSADQIIQEIRDSRVSTRQIEPF